LESIDRPEGTVATSEEGKRLEAAIAEQERIDRERAQKVADDARAEIERKRLVEADHREAAEARRELQRREREGR
jgi:hypothetical protein